MSKRDKRVTRDMRMMMLKIHNDLKDIKNTVEETNHEVEEIDVAPRRVAKGTATGRVRRRCGATS